jgi:hypothetical protein
MLTERDIYAAARVLVAHRGLCAPGHAAARAAMLMRDGNHKGGWAWLRVKAEAEKMLEGDRVRSTALSA